MSTQTGFWCLRPSSQTDRPATGQALCRSRMRMAHFTLTRSVSFEVAHFSSSPRRGLGNQPRSQRAKASAALGAALRNWGDWVWVVKLPGRARCWPGRLGRLGRGGSPEFEQVVGQANELPFGLHLGDAPEGEWAETACWFDLTAVFIHRKTGPARLVPFVSGRSHAPFWFAAYGPDAASG